MLAVRARARRAFALPGGTGVRFCHHRFGIIFAGREFVHKSSISDGAGSARTRGITARLVELKLELNAVILIQASTQCGKHPLRMQGGRIGAHETAPSAAGHRQAVIMDVTPGCAASGSAGKEFGGLQSLTKTRPVRAKAGLDLICDQDDTLRIAQSALAAHELRRLAAALTCGPIRAEMIWSRLSCPPIDSDTASTGCSKDTTLRSPTVPGSRLLITRACARRHMNRHADRDPTRSAPTPSG